MKKIRFFFVIALLLLPVGVSAHATPVDMQPHSGSVNLSAPDSVSIRFSERLEPGSSLIRVVDENGVRSERAEAVVGGDGYTLSVPMQGGEGIYTVKWSVVSKDDGHFTRGSYAFSVGERAAPATSDEEMVQIASTKEAALIFVEFLGNSLLWGMLALYLLMPERRLRRIFIVLSFVAVAAALISGAGQLVLKSIELAGLHDISRSAAFMLYVKTVAGSSTLVRMAALSLGGLLAALTGFKSSRTTIVVVGVPLLVFAYFRAIVSHASANPFYPALSVAVNFVHVIEKDLWLGVLLVVSILYLVRSGRALVPELMPRVLSLLSANLAILAASASYIVWLHLKEFENVAASAWGQAFVPLLASALALIVLHAYLVFIHRFRPNHFARFSTVAIGAATAAAMLVVFFSSVVIITSPPPHDVIRVHSSSQDGTSIRLSRAPYEDSMALVEVRGAVGEPTVMIGERDGGLKPALIKRFEGGYVFPRTLIGTGTTQVFVIVSRENAYDAQASFTVSGADFAQGDSHGRSLNTFTLIMIGIAACGVAFAGFIRGIAGRGTIDVPTKVAGATIIISFVIGLVGVSGASLGLMRVFVNDFKTRCIDDGNMWHMMQPTYAGVPVSGTSREGCMWGMGAYPYQFVDLREYSYLNALGDATVTLEHTPSQIVAGRPTDLTFRLQNADGTPATLLMDMEKLLHAVIVSEDETVFAHIHPDDEQPLSQDAIDSSTFTMRYTFPKSGTYLVSVDYAHGTQLESRQFKVHVAGAPAQQTNTATYASPGTFGGYTVAMDHSGAFSGEVTTLKFNVTKNGTPVTDMRSYLSAVSHISVVKNDLNAFVHTHGEVHAPGTPYLPVIVRDGKIVHAMSAMEAPASFGPLFEAHVLFPSAGRYTVWAQINVGGRVIPARFTVDVE